MLFPFIAAEDQFLGKFEPSGRPFLDPKVIITDFILNISSSEHKHQDLPKQVRHAHAKRMRDGMKLVISFLIPKYIKPYETCFAIAELPEPDSARV